MAEGGALADVFGAGRGKIIWRGDWVDVFVYGGDGRWVQRDGLLQFPAVRRVFIYQYFYLNI